MQNNSQHTISNKSKGNYSQGKSLALILNGLSLINLSLKVKLFTLATTLLFFTTIASSQQTNRTLHLIARPLQDSILLRWAPSTYGAWDLGNQYGYKVERYTIVRDSLLLDKREYKLLTAQPLKPLGLNQWEPLVKTDRFGGLAAQALYGKAFDITANGGTTPQNIATKAGEQRQRFSFALYAADMSAEVAKASGLWFTDTKAKKNEKYLYRVYAALPEGSGAKTDTAFVFTGIPEHAPLPKPIEVAIGTKEKTADIRWNEFAHDNIYTAWEVERSGNGGETFRPATKGPFVPFVGGEGKTEYVHVLDTLPEYGKEYQYRVRGISPFGEKGPWSEIVKGKGREEVKRAPLIKGYEVVNGQAILRWDFPEEEGRKISHFKVMRSEDDNTGFGDIAVNVPKEKREHADSTPLLTAYYKVVAVAPGEMEKASPPFMVQIADTMPPAVPKGLAGAADSLRKIHLSWQPNTEKDILGYYVFRSASGNDEFMKVTKRPVTGAEFMDSVQKNDLNPGVYYKIMAVDQRYNKSGFTEVVHVNKVDQSAPSFPVLRSCKATAQGIGLSWTNSTSPDVDRHEILRHQDGGTAWTKIGEVKNREYVKGSTYLDTEAPAGKTCRYHIVAIDKAGNISRPAVSIDIRALKTAHGPKIEKIGRKVDYEKGRITLSWEQPEKPVKYFKIYRKTSEKRYSVYETLDGTQNTFEDYGMKAGDFYAYRIKIIYGDGGVSGFSDETRIDF